MANPIQKLIQNIVGYGFGVDPKDPYDSQSVDTQKRLVELINYFNGNQRKPLKISGVGKDYNVVTNLTRTIVDRSVHMLVGAGVDFDLPGEGESEQDRYINDVMDANNKDILLHDLAQFGGIYGTPALKILPYGRTLMNGGVTHRIVALNPFNLSIFTAHDDIDNVLAYVYRWMDGEVARRELTEKQQDGWHIIMQHNDRSTRGKWVDDSNALFTDGATPYPFPPIIHAKNLPNAGSVYGYSDIEDVIELQDKYNEAQSNINKILNLQAFAQLYVAGGKLPRKQDEHGNSVVDTGPDKALEVAGDNVKIGLLQPSGDLTSSRSFVNDIRRDMFDISSTVDAETVKDKVGALTNFGLRVLFKNEIAKNATKQLLYGEMLKTLVQRLLIIGGFSDTDPGEVKFGDPLPVDDVAAMNALNQEIAMGIRSKESAAKERGIDWEVEQERLAKEKQQSANIGGNMIRDFLSGK